MVKVDDATYVAMRDNLYKGDSAAASRAKAQIESNYTQEQYDKFVSGLGNVNNKPTAPTNANNAPANNQTSNTNVNQPDIKEETVIEQQETTGSTVPEIKQEGELKPLSQEYYNQTSADAQSKIISNLNNYRQTNPELFSDYESFKKNFSYDARNEEQKNTLDTRYGGYQKGMQLAGVPVTDLYTQYKDGQVSVNELENLRVANPQKYAELQNQINKGNIISAYDDSTGAQPTSIQDMAYQMAQQTFLKFMSGDNTSGASNIFRDYEAKMNDPEMLALSDQTTELQEEMENIQSDLDSIKKQVEKEYEGTGASRSKINAIIADRSYELDLQLRTLNSEYNKYATQYNNRMNQYQNEFQLQLQEYQINQQARQQQMSELGFALDLMNFETNEQKAQREWDYWVKQQEYTNGNINSKDYQTRYKAALKSVQNLLSQYEGIPMQRSAEQMADDILKAIDQGSDLGTELTKINKQIQQKPEYKYLYNQTYASASVSTGGIQDTMKVGDIEWVKYNGEWYTSDEFNSMFGGKAQGSTGAAKPYDAVSQDAFSLVAATGKDNNLGGFLLNPAHAINKKGGQCGKFVNDYLVQIGMTTNANRYYDNELSTKLNSVNTYTPTKGAVAVFDYGHKSSDGINHGHVGIVTQVYEDGSFDVLDSNFNGDEIIHKRRINPGSSSLKGFFDPSKPPMGANTGNEGDNTSFVSGSIEGVPLAYERAVKNLVPAALQNSDKEREALDKIISNSYNGGIDQSEIALTYMGFDIKDASNKKLAMDLVNTVRTLSTDTQEGIVQTISDLMNQGDYTKAIQTVENAVSQQAKNAGNYVSELSVKNTINKSNDLYNTINSLNKSPVGVVSGTMESRLGKYASKDAKNIQSKISLLENALDIKDKETAQRILPQLTDNPATFMTKLENLSSNMMSELNGWRTIYGLPALSTDALTNYSNRVDLYRNGEATNNNNLGIIQGNQQKVTQADTKRAIDNLKKKYGLK